jgi:hypothetical protein
MRDSAFGWVDCAVPGSPQRITPLARSERTTSTSASETARIIIRLMPAALSPLARVVLDVLWPAPGTAADLARETKLPIGVVEIALTELVNAGRVVMHDRLAVVRRAAGI